MTTRSSVERFLSEKSLALAGASRSGRKFGNTIVRDLRSKGYDLSLVHPDANEIDGLRCAPSVAQLPEHIWGLIVVLPPDRTELIVREAAASGIRNIWLQQGSESADAVSFCEDHGINVVHGECILMFAEPKGLHRFHRWVWGVLGKLPVHDG